MKKFIIKNIIIASCMLIAGNATVSAHDHSRTTIAQTRTIAHDLLTLRANVAIDLTRTHYNSNDRAFNLINHINNAIVKIQNKRNFNYSQIESTVNEFYNVIDMYEGLINRKNLKGADRVNLRRVAKAMTKLRLAISNGLLSRIIGSTNDSEIVMELMNIQRSFKIRINRLNNRLLKRRKKRAVKHININLDDSSSSSSEEPNQKRKRSKKEFKSTTKNLNDIFKNYRRDSDSDPDGDGAGAAISVTTSDSGDNFNEDYNEYNILQKKLENINRNTNAPTLFNPIINR